MAPEKEKINFEALRKRGTPPGAIYTRGVASLTLDERDALIEAVEAFNDWHGYHDTNAEYRRARLRTEAALARFDFGVTNDNR